MQGVLVETDSSMHCIHDATENAQNLLVPQFQDLVGALNFDEGPSHFGPDQQVSVLFRCDDF